MGRGGRGAVVTALRSSVAQWLAGYCAGDLCELPVGPVGAKFLTGIQFWVITSTVSSSTSLETYIRNHEPEAHGPQCSPE